MRAGILGLLTDAPDETAVESDATDSTAVDAEYTEYLDGARIYHGEAASHVRTTTQQVTIEPGGSFTVEDVGTNDWAVTEWTADLAAGFVTVDTGDGDWLWDWLSIGRGFRIERATLDLDALAADLDSRDRAECWQLTQDHGDAVGIDYHATASLDQAVRGGVEQLGFEYVWDGTPVYGTAAASGYVAVYEGPTSPEAWGRWLREELLPVADLPEDDQQTLGDGEPCAMCGRESDNIEHVDGDPLCPVCYDRREERGAA